VSDDRGLVGGRQELRVERGQIRPIEHPAALELVGERAAQDRERAAAFIAGAPLEAEIGFGRGRFLAELAAARPETRFLAFETRTRWCWSLLNHIDARRLTNVRVLRGDVRSYLADLVPDGALQAVYLLFPDPWWKKRHHRRRLLSPGFLALLARKLAPGGSFWVKSDVPMTIRLAEEELEAAPGFAPGDPAPAAALPHTDREERCLALGLPVHVRRFVRSWDPPEGEEGDHR
jgi:tRNA (guanine-N7-)-methyltransferase